MYLHPKLLLLTTIMLLMQSVSAQTVTANSFFSATNASNNGTLTVGANDLHWTVSNTGINGNYVPAVSCGNVFPVLWFNSNIQNANWISYPNSCLTGDFAEHSCLNPIDQDRYYKNLFYLPGNSCESSTLSSGVFCLQLAMYADNCIYEVFVNGQLAYQSPITSPYWYTGYAANAAVNLNICDNWKAGANELIVHVTSAAANFPTWEGLFATATCSFNGSSSYSVIPITITAANCANASFGSATITALSPGSPVTYTWLPSGGNGSVATNLTPGTYTVLVQVGNCINSQTIIISKEHCTQLEELRKSSATIAITPNPNLGSFIIKAQSHTSAYLFNDLGQIVKGLQFNAENNYSIEVENLEAGIYYLRIGSETEPICKKIVVIK